MRLPTALETIPRTIQDWLETREDLAHCASVLADEDLVQVCARLASDRVGLLSHLKHCGVTRLGDRQRICNGLGKDRREGRIWLPGEPPPTQAAQPRVDAKAVSQVSSAGAAASSRPSATKPYAPRDAAAMPDDDDVMTALLDYQPSRGMRIARALHDSPCAWILRARAHIAMGSLTSASIAYRTARDTARFAGAQMLVSLATDESARLATVIEATDALAHSRRFFYPRVVPRADPPHAERFDGTYATGDVRAMGGGAPVEIGYRLYRCAKSPIRGRAARGLLLYFHGNGEVASDYDGISELYNLMGMHLMVVEFRGYGWSTDEPPRLASMLSDAEPLIESGALDRALRAAGLDPHALPVIVFGRSMGSPVAIHLAAYAPERFAGLVVESGMAGMRENEDDGSVITGVAIGGVDLAGIGENRPKLRELTGMHTLVLHGDADRLVPPENARRIYDAAGAPADGDGARKSLVLIEGAGHNDIAMAEAYFMSIVRFFDEVIPS